ncbi:unnamed protein product, partial [Didymodactylos carnosus]
LSNQLEPVYYVRYGSSFSIQCLSKADDTSIIWEKNGATIVDDDRIKVLSEMLFIDTVNWSHNGTYSCTLQTQTQIACRQTSFWVLNIFERTEQVSSTIHPNLLNYIGTSGSVLNSASLWHVTISYRDLSNKFSYDAFCSGLLLDEDTVLTVSNCFHETSSLLQMLKQQNLNYEKSKIVLYVGKYDRYIKSLFERSSNVREMVFNQEYVIIKTQLLYLSAEARPLRLALMDDMRKLTDFQLYATGWGPLGTNSQQSIRLKYVQQQLIDCNITSSSYLCTTAVGSKLGPNLCPGDTGGVLFALSRDKIFAFGLVDRFLKPYCDQRIKQVTSILRLDSIKDWILTNKLP